MTLIQIASAGSTQAVIKQIAEDFCAAKGLRFELRYGPAGLLAQGIFDGISTDVYVSASSDGPRRLFEAGLFSNYKVIAQNRMVLVARPGLEFPDDDPLSWLAVPGLRLVTSTPGADPSGDYAAAFLDALSRRDPAFGQDLRARTKALFGAQLPDPGKVRQSASAKAVREGTADLFMVYETSAERIFAEHPTARAVPLPEDLSPRTSVCAALRIGSDAPAAMLFEHLSSDQAARTFREAGFLPPPA